MLLGVVVGAFERDVFGRQVGADALKEMPQVHAGPLADIVPALDADVPDDQFLLGQRVDLLGGPGAVLFRSAQRARVSSLATSTGLTSSMS